MGRFGDWAKGPWKDTVRVTVAYTVTKLSGKFTRYEIITVIPRQSLDYHRDAAARAIKDLSRTVKPPDFVTIESTTVEGEVPFIHPSRSF